MKTLKRVTKVGGEVQDREAIIKWFNKLLDKSPDGEFMVEVTPTDRTDAQNKFYWVCVHIIAKEFGMSDYKLHEVFKEKFLPKRDYFVLIKSKNVTSTTDQSRDEMTSFIDKVIMFAAEQGIVIPDPEDYKHHQS